MPALDLLIPTPAQVEIDRVDLASPAARVWDVVRHADLARSPLTRALFALRTLPSRVTGGAPPQAPSLRLDDLVSTPARPGFQILADAAPHEVVVGAIGKVWHLDIPFVHVSDAAQFAAFAEPGNIKVAWALRVTPRGEEAAHLELEVRVSATDEESWRKFRRYFLVVGPGSHFIRRSLLRALEADLGTVSAREEDRALPGDERLPDGTQPAP